MVRLPTISKLDLNCLEVSKKHLENRRVRDSNKKYKQRGNDMQENSLFIRFSRISRISPIRNYNGDNHEKFDRQSTLIGSIREGRFFEV